VSRNVRLPLAGCLACALAFALLVLGVYRSETLRYRDSVVLAHFAESGSRSGSVTAGVASLGDPAALLLMLALACGIALARRQPRPALAALAVVAGASLTTQIFKAALAHPRFQEALGDQIAANSFPSGHVTAVASIAIAFAFVVPRHLRPLIAWLGTALVVAVGCAVMALTWHYPSDVLGGILVAAGWGFAVLAALWLFEDGYRPPRQVPRRAAISLK